MNKKFGLRYKKLFPVILLLLYVFSGCAGENGTVTAPTDAAAATYATESVGLQQNGEGAAAAEIARIGDELPVSRALVAKMLSLAYSDKNSIDTADREIDFRDTATDKWYDRYINIVVNEGLMSGVGTEFLPEKPLTIYQTQILLDKLDANNKIKLQITDENRDKPISYALWNKFYQQLLENLSGDTSVEENFGIVEENMIVMITPDNNDNLNKWNLIASSGAYTCAGYSVKEYIDKEITVLTKEGEIVSILGIANSAPVIRNAYVVQKTEDSITVFSGGAERTYQYNTSALDEGKICDIKINGTQAEAVQIFNEKITGTVKEINSSMVELEEYGRILTDGDFKIYSTVDGTAKWKTPSAVTIGSDIAEFVMRDGTICSAVIIRKAVPEKIRAVISTTGFNGYIHGGVDLTGTGGFSVVAGKETKVYKKGEMLTVSALENADLFGNDRIYIYPDKDSKLVITSISRNWPDGESPKYGGVIEIARNEGGFTIVNEVSIQEYLYAVVPSEMPTSHGVEAAKVQAITARSYAYNQFYSNKYYKYGANVDDSVNCQVYNNIPENETSIQAVNETAGQYLAFDGAVISANFFSTSAGMTANTGDVWSDYSTKEFPTSSVPYLRAVKQYTAGDYGDLSVEENAYAFFKNTEVESYDSQFAWFRWNVEMTAKELEASINKNLKTRYEAGKHFVKTLDETGVYRSRPIETIGAVRGFEVVSRGEGGNITELKIVGTKATILVTTEYNIRMLLRPAKIGDGKDIVMNRGVGSSVNNYSLMPSAFFVFDEVKEDGGNLLSVKFYGGGNGHGVGMSQNGVKGMIDLGYGCEEILQHYYPGTKLININ